MSTSARRGALPDETRCPSCGAELGNEGRGTTRCQACGAEPANYEDEVRAPWHFKVLLIATALYLVYRLVWFAFWLAGHAWHG